MDDNKLEETRRRLRQAAREMELVEYAIVVVLILTVLAAGWRLATLLLETP